MFYAPTAMQQRNTLTYLAMKIVSAREFTLHLAAKRNGRTVLVVGDILPTNAMIGGDRALELHPVRKPKRHGVLREGRAGRSQLSVHRVAAFAVERLACDKIALCGS